MRRRILNEPVVTCYMVIDDHEEEVSLPAKFEACPRCRGRGTHVNPSIDGNGLTRDDFDQDPDFEESYFRGDYDVACYECRGARVVAVIDRARSAPTSRLTRTTASKPTSPKRRPAGARKCGWGVRP